MSRDDAAMYVPYVRCTRLVHSLRIFSYLYELQRSPAISYSEAKFLFVLTVFFLAAHLSACVFHTGSRISQMTNGYYSDAPWVLLDADGNDVSPLDASGGKQPPLVTLYLRALYWSFCQLSTVGHADQIGGQTGGGRVGGGCPGGCDSDSDAEAAAATSARTTRVYDVEVVAGTLYVVIATVISRSSSRRRRR